MSNRQHPRDSHRRSAGPYRHRNDNRGQQDEALDNIPSPYNFVAVDGSYVAQAEHPETIHHDTPFQNGLSGWLDLEIKATTPIYIRAAGDFREYCNSKRADSGFVSDCERLVGEAHHQSDVARRWGQSQGDVSDNFRRFTDFYRLPDGRPAIPGSSLRGVIRQLLEMVTNSRLGPVGNRRYAVRDLSNPDPNLYSGWMIKNSGPEGSATRVQAGWLRRNEMGDWVIQPCDFARVEQEDLERFKRMRDCQLGKKQSLKDKRREWERAGGTFEMEWVVKQDKSHSSSSNLHLRGKKLTPSTSGTKGTLVFTGQPAERKPGKNRSKRLEFVFLKSEQPEVTVLDDAKKKFLETHTDAQDQPTEAWEYWKQELEKGQRVPIFYLAFPSEGDARADSKTVELNKHNYLYAFGLAMMFRLAYKHSLGDAIPLDHQESSQKANRPDFVEGIFGYQRKDQDEGLRGRVSFGPCGAFLPRPQLPPVVTVLSSPKPTFYPNYLEQPFDQNRANKLAPGKAYATLMDSPPTLQIRGWKFYPAFPDGHNPIAEQKEQSQREEGVPLPPAGRNGSRSYKVATAFRPLASGTVFRGRLRFHNLRPNELGALVWALTWGGNPNPRHRLGMAKPLGYGCAQISIVGGRLIPNDMEQPEHEWTDTTSTPGLLQEAMKAFESTFQPRLKSEDIQDDLLSMAAPDHGVELVYPDLDKKEFVNAKKQQLVLARWRYIKDRKPCTPLIDKPAQSHDPRNDRFQSKGPGRREIPPPPTQKTPYAVGQIVECEVTVRKEAPKRKAKLEIVGGGPLASGGLNPGALSRFSEIPQVGQRIRMKITNSGTGGYQFTFPDL